VDGVIQSWTKVVQDLNMLPDEGVCIGVLHTAARHGLPELAADVLRVLKLMGASWQEYHFAAVIEAFCNAGQMKDAFSTLKVMRSASIQPLSGTVASIFDTISRDADALDAAWSLIDEMNKDEEPVDVVLLNVIIQAAVVLGDLQRAMGLYKVFADYHAKPTVDTFNLLLSGCVATSHRELGDRILADMKETKVRPDSRTYENIILLCLTQPTYEDAFFYLEEMKAGKHRPTLKVYETLILKCISVGDTRYTLAFEEMTQCGHPISRELQTIVRNGTPSESPPTSTQYNS
jgi:pentatricopeptide repeat protein